MPVVQFLGISKYKLKLSTEEIHHNLMPNYPNVKVNYEVNKLINLVKSLYISPNEYGDLLTETQKNITVKANLERFIKKIVEKIYFGMVKFLIEMMMTGIIISKSNTYLKIQMKTENRVMVFMYKKIIKKDEIHSVLSTHHKIYNKVKVNEALAYAEDKHKGQLRKTGEPYIYHPMRVAKIVAEFGFESEVIIAAILHDVVEDCDVPLEKIVRLFGADVADMVDSLTAVNEKLQKENNYNINLYEKYTKNLISKEQYLKEKSKQKTKANKSPAPLTPKLSNAFIKTIYIKSQTEIEINMKITDCFR